MSLLEELIKLQWKVFEKGKASKEHTKKQQNEFLKVASKAVRRTLSYIRDENKRDTKTEVELADLWADVAVAARPFDSDLAGRCYIKGNYWANPDKWSDEEVEKAGIEIKRIEKEIGDYFKGKARPKKSKQQRTIEKAKLPNGGLSNSQNAVNKGDKYNEKWYQTNTFKFVIVPLVVALFLGIPTWLSIGNKTDHIPTASTNIFAEVSKDGSILRSNKFPWEIRKSNDQLGNILYTIVDRRGDATAVSVFPDNPKYTVYQSYDGMVIKFTCSEEEISNFTIKLKY